MVPPKHLVKDIISWNKDYFDKNSSLSYLRNLCKMVNSRFPKENAPNQVLLNALNEKDQHTDSLKNALPQIPILKLDLKVPGTEELRNNWHC